MNPKKKNIKRRKQELQCDPPGKAISNPPRDKSVHSPNDPQSKVKDKMIRNKRTK